MQKTILLGPLFPSEKQPTIHCGWSFELSEMTRKQPGLDNQLRRPAFLVPRELSGGTIGSTSPPTAPALSSRPVRQIR